MKKVKFFAAAFIALLAVTTTKAQLSVGADVVSSYVWRGVTQSADPNFQPTISYTAKKFVVGAWGSSDFSGAGTKEVDIFATYNITSILGVTLTDYQYNLLSTPYFKYDKSTGHVFEGTLNYAGVSSFPLSASLNVMFAGADKKYTGDKQAYSTYLELGYPIGSNFKVFAGASLTESQQYKTKGFGVVNLGVKASKTIEIGSFSLPVYGILGVNPYGTYDPVADSAKDTNTAFFVVGVTL